MTESELTKIFKAIYNSPDLSGTAAKFLFGIQYVGELKNMSTKRLARMEERATGRPATALEIRKGKAIAPYVQVNDKSGRQLKKQLKDWMKNNPALNPMLNPKVRHKTILLIWIRR